VWARRVSDPKGPALATALQEQLGLRLESTKAPITVIVIKSAARPSSDPGTEVTLPFVWQFLNDGYRVIFKLPANSVEAVVHVASNQSSIGNEQAGEARNKHHDSHSDN
jgi:hypothetical protein